MSLFNTNRICGLLGVKYPFIEGGMAWVGTPRLAAAVSEAGGLGTIGSGALTPEDLAESIDTTRRQTNKPFAVNVMLLNPSADRQVEVCLQKAIPVLIFGAGNPAKYLPDLKKRGIVTAAVVASETLALYLEERGIDVIIGEGMECGGHVGTVTTFTLIPALKDVLFSVPVVAAGGIADERGIKAAFCLGAEGVQIGTRLIATVECEAHDRYKQRIITSGIRDTLLTGQALGHPARVLKSAFAKRVCKLEASDPKEAESLITGSLRKAFEDGDEERGLFMAGQSAGLIQSIPSVSELFELWAQRLDGWNQIAGTETKIAENLKEGVYERSGNL
ncbi:MAG TPA: nitronate monooxygenase [Thermotogota bacterium]|jgi:enoyl-[acyl-carrier protein] reductase II|nr:nitronate monooxygenase [Thermotogota bacterium]NLH19871.1 enoyl-[acyl-carrier-protein] reductase FabK [Thermotogaceae bacterium]OQC31893.1 MAG: Nitronate monooxygenase [Thermotogota bacterium ADurb.Bin062]HNW47168.1 nitronate monooxygenase [Thermotogota bacterium]HNY82282.1 nitronate monooxygenase [Thermotogota bacterium]